MNTDNVPRSSVRALSISSLFFAILGGLFFWWVPMGMVFGLTGLIFSFVDLTVARRHSQEYRLSFIAFLLAIAVLALDIAIAVLGWQIWTFGPL